MLRHAKIQRPLFPARSALSHIWRSLFALLGRYRPISDEDQKLAPADVIPFRGDIPLRAGNKHSQTRVVYKNKRPSFESVENLIVTPHGAGFKDGVLFEKYSSEKPGLRAFFSGGAPAKTIERAFFVQAVRGDTFGDWTSEYLAPLARVGIIDAPVLLPAKLIKRSYVQRDAKRLGIAFEPITERTLIENATVVRQTRFVRNWSKEDTDVLGGFLGAEPKTPEPGSIIYLSRCGETTNVVVRSHPHSVIEETIRDHGGKVIRTAETDLQGYVDAGQHAETVVFDHGSAGYNMIYWKPKRVIEIVSDDWWLNAFLIFANAIGVEDYVIVRSDLGDETRVKAQLSAYLSSPS